VREQRVMRVVQLGLVANVGLALLKTIAGIGGHSPSLLADGINSTSDVAYYVIVAVFMRLARKPPDHEHPYGHNQFESIAALVVGFARGVQVVLQDGQILDTIIHSAAGQLQNYHKFVAAGGMLVFQTTLSYLSQPKT